MSVWFKLLCLVFGHRWRVIARSEGEDGALMFWRGPPAGCYSVCVICRVTHDDLTRKSLQ